MERSAPDNVSPNLSRDNFKEGAFTSSHLTPEKADFVTITISPSAGGHGGMSGAAIKGELSLYLRPTHTSGFVLLTDDDARMLEKWLGDARKVAFPVVAEAEVSSPELPFDEEATIHDPLFILGSEPPKSAAPFRVMPMPPTERVVTYQEHELLESEAFKERVQSIVDEMRRKGDLASPSRRARISRDDVIDFVWVVVVLAGSLFAIYAAFQGGTP